MQSFSVNLAKITCYQRQAVIPVSCVAQAILISRLQNKEAGSQTSDSLMKAVNVCDKFLTGAQGTQAELDVLKSQVRLTLAQKVCCMCDWVHSGCCFYAGSHARCLQVSVLSKPLLCKQAVVKKHVSIPRAGPSAKAAVRRTASKSSELRSQGSVVSPALCCKSKHDV